MSEWTNEDRFNQEYQKHYILKRRAPLPPGTRSRPTEFGQHSITLGLFYNDAELGTVSYFVGSVRQLYVAPLATLAPYLYQPVVVGSPALPRLLIITAFDSNYEKTIKGIGSTMLRELLKIADQGECRYLVVASGVNHEVYTALGFDLIDPLMETWCMPISRLRARVSPLRGAREAP